MNVMRSSVAPVSRRLWWQFGHMPYLATMLLALAVVAGAQQGSAGKSSAEKQPAAAQQAQPVSESTQDTQTPAAQLADAANDAAEREPNKSEDENAQFKQSFSVKWIARHLGITVDLAYWLCVVLNFVIVAALVGYGMKKWLPGIFRQRTQAIQRGMEEARRASEDANRRLREIEDKLARLDAEIAQLQATASAQADEEAARLKAASEEEQRRIIQNAEQEIGAAANAARRELKAYSAELAVSLAEKRIKVDVTTDKELVRDFVDQLGRNGSQ
ncbi:MAG TPA: ATP synthase F0 subunit B [Terriglobales bacterium]|jgi:F-type H+-transporting ATPase subunit b|nr:ATP synthase F0 subunit B [Terriglobales bacterium]